MGIFCSAFFAFVCVSCFYFILFLSLLYPFLVTMSFAGYFLVRFLLSDFPAFFHRPRSRFDLVWFRLSCDHGWIRGGSVNVR